MCRLPGTVHNPITLEPQGVLRYVSVNSILNTQGENERRNALEPALDAGQPNADEGSQKQVATIANFKLDLAE